MTLQIISKIVQHIQPYKENHWQWTCIGCRHWDSPENKYLCSQKIFPRTSAHFAWAVDKSPKLFSRYNHWRLQPQRVSWYHRHCSSFSLIRKSPTERCWYSFQNWAVSNPSCLGSHLSFPYCSDQKWQSCSQVLSRALHSSCATPSGQWRSRDHIDSSHGCHRLHTKTIFYVSHLHLIIDYLFLATFWKY